VQTKHRSVRDKWLMTAAVIGLAAAALAASGDVVRLSFYFKPHIPTDYRISAALRLANDIPLAIGFGLVALAFGSSSNRRQRLLGFATISMGLALTLYLLSSLVAIRYDSSSVLVSRRQLVVDILIAGYALAQVIAAVPIAKGFFRASRGDRAEFRERDGHLKWGAIALAISFAALASSELLLVTFSASPGATSEGITNGWIIVALSGFVLVAGWLLAASAFLRRHMAKRDSLLATSAALFAIALLGTGVGSLIGASAAGSIDPSSLYTAAWLGAAGAFGQMGAAICTSVAFFVYRNKQADGDAGI
jgi:hypothetical protein